MLSIMMQTLEISKAEAEMTVWFSLDRPAQSSWEKIKIFKTQVMAKTL